MLTFRPVTRTQARAFVDDYHSHHDAHTVDVFRIGACVDGALVAVVVAGTPTAEALDNGLTWEVTRLCCSDAAPKYTASRILARIRHVAAAAGVDLLVSYTRIDERGTCYLASNYTPVAVVRGRRHNTGNRAARYLPGLEPQSTEVIDRVRWECGPRARAVGACWDAGLVRWVGSSSSDELLCGATPSSELPAELGGLRHPAQAPRELLCGTPRSSHAAELSDPDHPDGHDAL